MSANKRRLEKTTSSIRKRGRYEEQPDKLEEEVVLERNSCETNDGDGETMRETASARSRDKVASTKKSKKAKSSTGSGSDWKAKAGELLKTDAPLSSFLKILNDFINPKLEPEHLQTLTVDDIPTLPRLSDYNGGHSFDVLKSKIGELAPTAPELSGIIDLSRDHQRSKLFPECSGSRWDEIVEEATKMKKEFEREVLEINNSLLSKFEALARDSKEQPMPLLQKFYETPLPKDYNDEDKYVKHFIDSCYRHFSAKSNPLLNPNQLEKGWDAFLIVPWLDEGLIDIEDSTIMRGEAMLKASTVRKRQLQHSGAGKKTDMTLILNLKDPIEVLMVESARTAADVDSGKTESDHNKLLREMKDAWYWAHVKTNKSDKLFMYGVQTKAHQADILCMTYKFQDVATCFKLCNIDLPCTLKWDGEHSMNDLFQAIRVTLALKHRIEALKHYFRDPTQENTSVSPIPTMSSVEDVSQTKRRKSSQQSTPKKRNDKNHIEGYEIKKPIVFEIGGSTIIWHAADENNCDVVLKFFKPGYLQTGINELRSTTMANEMNVPHVIQVLDAFEPTADWACHADLVIVYPLLEKIDFNTKISVVKIISITRQLALALQGLHKLHIVHGDISCYNVMQDNKGNVYLIDFGESCVELPGSRFSGNGTLGCTAPEAVAEDSVTHKSDIFSLGVLLLHMLAYHLEQRNSFVHRDDYFKYLSSLALRVLKKKLERNVASLLRLGIKMVSVDPIKRPSASEILQCLEVCMSFEESSESSGSLPADE